MADTTIPTKGVTMFFDALNKGNIRIAKRFHGDSPLRQPVHTFNSGADRFSPDMVAKLGAVALRTLEEYAPDVRTFSEVLPYEHGIAELVYPRVVEKLSREPIEDLRIDFEEGFGERS